MRKKPAVVDDRSSTDITLYGRRAEERYDDADLAILGEMALEKASLHRQQITRLPPFSPSLKTLWLAECPSLESLDGIERLVGLQRLWLTELPRVDFDRAFALLAELPELTELELGGACLQMVPAAIAKVPSVLSVGFYEAANVDFTRAFASIGEIATLRNVRVWGTPVSFPETIDLAPLRQISVLEVRRARGAMFPSVSALGELTKLSLEDSSFRELPSLAALVKLEELILKRNPIRALPDDLCACAELQLLDVRDTELRALPAQIGRLAKLKKLDAWGAKKLRALPDSIGELANLRELWIPSTSQAKLDALVRLQLEKFVGPDAIEKQLTLRPPPTPEADRVYLSDAERIPDDFGDPLEIELSLATVTAPLPQLSKLRRLKEISIDTGNLADAFTRLARAEHLRKVCVEGDHETIPDSIGELLQITSLAIESRHGSTVADRCQLARLPAAIGKLVELVKLRIGVSRLTALPEEIGDLASLEIFELGASDIGELPASIGRLQKLRTFGLSTGKLTRLPATLAQCGALAELRMGSWYGADNTIENLEIVGELPALRSLALSRLRKLPLARIIDALAGGGLEELDLRDTYLPELPPNIGVLAKLRKLELDGTEVKSLPTGLRDCTELRYISLPVYKLEREVLANIKDHLPKGRWKKNYRSSVTWWTRSD